MWEPIPAQISGLQLSMGPSDAHHEFSACLGFYSWTCISSLAVTLLKTTEG
ncbi:hypothetical protein BHE74_00050237 [Ensete ventricosum]|nr:hypothetical protein GW17_00008305 [Ensete ventricosum]RWW44039.1 hypothetical protein BHE74_00050237 [Ensete ventricosum]